MPSAKVKIQDRTIHLGDTFPLFRDFVMELKEEDMRNYTEQMLEIRMIFDAGKPSSKHPDSSRF